MDGCVFCKIAKGEIPCDKIYEDDKILAFNDINPEAPIHFLVIPKKHIESIMDFEDDDDDYLLHNIMKVIADISRKKGIDDKGFRIVNNIGKDGGQTVSHMHFHVLGGRVLQWPPG